MQIPQLDSFLRGLLFTDGTVSRALKAHTLCRVAVEPVEQEPGPTPRESRATWSSRAATNVCGDAW